MGLAYRGLAIAGFGLLASCAATQDPETVEFNPVYNGIERKLLDVDLVNLRVSMSGARDRADVVAYADCAVAQYALKRGYGFARHVRTNVTNDSGLWRADAVYTISPALPQGLRTLDAEVTVQNCVALGIPTV